jgi:hypothetical protein
VTSSRFRRTLLAGSVVLAACSSEPNQAVTVDCSAVSPTALSPGQFTVMDADQTACVRVPGGGAQESEYLYVPVATEGTQTQNGDSAPYMVKGGPGPAAVVAALRQTTQDQAPSPAQAFHDLLRKRERRLSEQPAAVAEARQGISASIVPVKPSVGSHRTFDVCATTTCDRFTTSTATAQFVGQQVAIFVDDSAPAGYTPTDLNFVGALFDNYLHPIDTTAFGPESDLDNNGVVIVLLTQHVNELSPDCNSSGNVILGFFFGLDLLPSQPHSNDGEIFYGIVPGTITPGCTISKTFANQQLPPVFIHEFQHMISFNQHVLIRGGQTEDTWLNEGLSHFAEELGGRLVPDAECPAASSCADQFIAGNIDDGYRYLNDTEASYLIEPGSSSGTLAERGANWLFVRWLGDHFAAMQPEATDLTRKLDQTSLLGSANVAAATGEDFSPLVSQWQLANYLDDLPGFTPASDRLEYTSWNFRALYQQNFQQGVFAKPYPLTPDSTRTGVYQHSGILRAGSGRHLRIIQPAGSAEAAFILTNTGGSATVAAAVKPRIALARVR